ncbi:MAG: hypothetical protein IKJ12_03905 [Rikenellaceae bacterium]|nr:hypothetical protein [Rikenellaceae bacterium]MBR4055795.1 hypothetical protein [Rikenellaceae bacterium]
MGKGCFGILLALALIIFVALGSGEIVDAGIWWVIWIVILILLAPMLLIKLIKIIIEFISSL